jgi:hypothetical protein
MCQTRTRAGLAALCAHLPPHHNSGAGCVWGSRTWQDNLSWEAAVPYQSPDDTQPQRKVGGHVLTHACGTGALNAALPCRLLAALELGLHRLGPVCYIHIHMYIHSATSTAHLQGSCQVTQAAHRLCQPACQRGRRRDDASTCRSSWNSRKSGAALACTHTSHVNNLLIERLLWSALLAVTETERE